MSKEIQYVVSRLEKATTSKQEFADALCTFYPGCSRFQIHARIYKDEMRDTLAWYIGEHSE